MNPTIIFFLHIPKICINKKKISLKDFIYYLLHNINIDGNIVNIWRNFIHLIGIGRV